MRREYMRNYNETHRDEKNAKARERNKANPQYAREYSARRMATDPVARLGSNMRTRTWAALKKQSTTKTSHLFDIVGMTGAELMQYLLSHASALPHFTLENYGKVWVVDHVKPLASFDLRDEAEQRKAFHYSNLQPLCAVENMKKGSMHEGRRFRHLGTYQVDNKIILKGKVY